MITYIIIIAILSVVSLFFIITTIKALKQIDLYVDNKKDMEKFIQSLQNKVIEWVNELEKIDRRGSFEADDEVGFFFKDLKNMLKTIRAYIFEKKEYKK